MSDDIQVYGDGSMSGGIQLFRDPDVILAEATRAAKALSTVLAGKRRKVMMNGEQYLEFEDWQTVARFYGITAKVTSTESVQYGSAHGFLARAEAIRSDGMVLSAAEAMCLDDEEKWSTRTKYVYEYILKDGSRQEEEPEKDQMVWVDNPNKPGGRMPKKERIARGEVNVPLFQLRSMAQTRACAKALRNVLAWVVVLAGYQPTTAEDMDGLTASDPQEPALKEPGKKKGQASGGVPPLVCTVELKKVDGKDGVKDGKPYTIYTILDVDDTKYATFDSTLADLARSAGSKGDKVTITYTVGKYGNKITDLTVAGPDFNRLIAESEPF